MVLALALAVSTLPVVDAAAQGRPSTLRTQTQVITGAISRNVQRAFRPRLQVRNGAGAVTGLQIGGQGRFMTLASSDGTVRVWDLENGRQIQALAAGPVRAVDIGVFRTATRTRSLVQDQRLLITVGDRGATVWDALGGTRLFDLSGHQGAVSAVRLSADGTLAATGGSDRTARLWDIATGKQGALLAHGAPVTAVAFSSNGRLLITGGEDGTLKFWEVPSGRPLATGTGHSGAVTALGVGTAEGEVISGGADGTVRVWSTADGRQLREWEVDDRVTGLQVGERGTVVVATGTATATIWQTATGRSVREIEDDATRIAGAALAVGGNKVITAGADGRAKVWDATSGQLQAQLIPTRQGWSVIDATGRFDGSEGGNANIDWAAEQATLNIQNFSDPYYEPGLLAKTLRAPQAMLTAQAVPVEQQGVGVPPTVTLTSSVGSQAGQPGPVQVIVTAENQGGGIQNVRLYHNDKLVDPARIAADVTDDPNRTVTFGVDLVGGANRFRAVATSLEAIEGAPAQTTVTVASAPAEPTLHIVSIGVNLYANPQMTLNYAVADAKGFVQWAKSKGGRGFKSVQVYELYDRKATKAAIEATLKGLARTAPQDVVMLYVASHGETSGANWYLLPTEFGRTMTLDAVAREGVGSTTIQDAVVNMGAQRVVLMIDACKSGTLRQAFGGDADRKRIQSVSRTAGIHVLAATEKNQLAVELENLGHGAFTYTVLEALSGRADRSPPDGTLNATEVLNYAVAEVPVVAFKYTQSEQFPTVYSQGSDFMVARTR